MKLICQNTRHLSHRPHRAEYVLMIRHRRSFAEHIGNVGKRFRHKSYLRNFVARRSHRFALRFEILYRLFHVVAASDDANTEREACVLQTRNAEIFFKIDVREILLRILIGKRERAAEKHRPRHFVARKSSAVRRPPNRQYARDIDHCREAAHRKLFIRSEKIDAELCDIDIAVILPHERRILFERQRRECQTDQRLTHCHILTN